MVPPPKKVIEFLIVIFIRISLFKEKKIKIDENMNRNIPLLQAPQ